MRPDFVLRDRIVDWPLNRFTWRDPEITNVQHSAPTIVRQLRAATTAGAASSSKTSHVNANYIQNDDRPPKVMSPSYMQVHNHVWTGAMTRVAPGSKLSQSSQQQQQHQYRSEWCQRKNMCRNRNRERERKEESQFNQFFGYCKNIWWKKIKRLLCAQIVYGCGVCVCVWQQEFVWVIMVIKCVHIFCVVYGAMNMNMYTASSMWLEPMSACECVDGM